jgi:hypothetical protein
MANKLMTLFTALICFMPSFSYAYNFEFTPSISIGELYDDNIYLENTNQESDWITTLSPSINLNFVSEKNNLSIIYNPSIVRYKKEDQNNSLRHSGAVAFNQNLNNRVSLNLGDTFTRSEDPIEQTQGIYGLRRTRRPYIRNSSTAGAKYLFGPENILNLNVNYSFLNNKDATLEDNSDLNPSADMTYWFNVNNGIDLTYQHNRVKYSRDDEGITSDNFSGNTTGIKYLYRFSSHATAFLDYAFNTRKFEKQINNYDVHDGSMGLTYSFSNETALSFSGGYFKLKNEVGNDDNGFSYNLLWTKKFNKGSVSLSSNGGWREGYLEAERQGLQKYRSVNTNIDYQLLEIINNHLSFSYMHEKGEMNNAYTVYSGNYGWRISFLRWYQLAVDYFRSTRKDDIKINNYNDNRVMLTLTASRLYK